MQLRIHPNGTSWAHIKRTVYFIQNKSHTPSNQTKGVIQNEANQFMAHFMNKQEIPCPKCKQYVAWIPNNN